MEEKIKLYEEILAVDPGSKLFFSLAELYWENGQLQDAISTLYSGLDKHPEHLEARLFLLKLLIEQGSKEEVGSTATKVGNVLASYKDFWFAWANRVENQGNIDLALALRFIGYNFSDSQVTWSDIFYMGFNSLNGYDQNLNVQGNKQEETPTEQGLSSKEADRLAKTGEYRTKTMADILVDQGDYAEAIDIYEELYQNSRDVEEKKRLRQLIDGLKGKQPDHAEKEQIQEKKQKLVQRLSGLSERLEARGI